MSLHRRIALVVLTHQRRALVCRNVERALALPERPTVVVVDNASSDGTSEALARFAGAVRVVRSARNLGAAGRNLGLAACSEPSVNHASELRMRT